MIKDTTVQDGDSFSRRVMLRIREERERLGINQEDFGKLGGIGRATQIFYESGTRFPSTAYFERLEKTGIDITYLLCGVRSLTTFNEEKWMNFKGEILWDLFTESIKIANPSASNETVAASLAAFKALCAVCVSNPFPPVLADIAARLNETQMID